MPNYSGNASEYYGLPTAAEEEERDSGNCEECGGGDYSADGECPECGALKEDKEDKMKNNMPSPNYVGEYGGKCWDINTSAKIWAHDEDRFELTTHLKLALTPEQAAAIAWAMKPQAMDLQLAQSQVARIVERQALAHGLEMSDDVLMDIAAQIVQALPLLGRTA